MKRRVPSLDDFLAYKGAHTPLLWEEVGPDWQCPVCHRTKFQTLRWTTRFPNSASPFQGWVAPLHKHHDHSVEFFSNGQSRFPRTIICDQCNGADGHAKKKLKLPKSFSFSPKEISVFVIGVPHDKHIINYEMAQAIYSDLLLAGEIKPVVKLVSDIDD
jgi:hypothetical protein